MRVKKQLTCLLFHTNKSNPGIGLPDSSRVFRGLLTAFETLIHTNVGSEPLRLLSFRSQNPNSLANGREALFSHMLVMTGSYQLRKTELAEVFLLEHWSFFQGLKALIFASTLSSVLGREEMFPNCKTFLIFGPVEA